MTNATPYSVAELRNIFRRAIDDEKAAEGFWQRMAGYAGRDAVILAYRATARALLARHGWNPIDKLAHLKESMRQYDRAVAEAPLNPEIRFLRFAIQHHLPDIVGMNGDLAIDKRIFLQQLANYEQFDLNRTDARLMAEFVQTSGRCSFDELRRLRAIFDTSAP